MTDARREPVGELNISALEGVVVATEPVAIRQGLRTAITHIRALADRLAAAEETNRIAALHLSEMEQRLAASEKEVSEIQALLGCHRAYIPESIRDLQAKTENIPNIDRVRQAEQRLAEVEKQEKEREAAGWVSRSYMNEALLLQEKKLAEVEREANSCADLYDRESKLRASLQQQLTDAQATIERLKTMSTVEMMGENHNVDAHVREWEIRCLKAEQQVARLREALAVLYDEQNDAPLENRRKQWSTAMMQASEALRETGA